MSPQHKLMPLDQAKIAEVIADAMDMFPDNEVVKGAALAVIAHINGPALAAISPTTDVSTDGLTPQVQRYFEQFATERAATIEALQRSNAEKDEALLDIRNRILCPVGPSPTLGEIAEIASKALSHSSETTSNG
jgi:hypothetical protein